LSSLPLYVGAEFYPTTNTYTISADSICCLQIPTFPTNSKTSVIMTSNTANPSAPQETDRPSLPFPAYFTALAQTYAKQTGNSTRNLFELAFNDIQAIAPITESSVVHDNAAGPGTASSVVLDHLPGTTVIVTDNVSAMVTAARDSLASFPAVTVQEVDAQKLEFPDGHFTHSILNFSIFNMSDPALCLREIYRTLRPGGTAVIQTWKRFAMVNMIHAAQAMVRPELPPMKLPHPEFLEEGVLAKAVVEAGFQESKMKVWDQTLFASGTDVEDLNVFLLGQFTNPARRGWSDEEDARWPEVVKKAVEEEVATHGGVKWESWVVVATK
jgi:ubiquinone/menaquinone biosynthesis C-methylase UbiE